MIIANEQTQVQLNETKKADETAVSTTARNRDNNDDKAAARRAKYAAMTADEINDALFG
ncbi:MAG: hypothetical protein IAF02_29300 [Anaerolineae bacterium]|nr:hypothetical protein [Anaerolineae bacterium]